ncbi:MAG: hypothetical protein IKI58_03455 [Oscillospiraceae bacterium]|nr:hypothetical protein [Oscillospiraceae bacterium]
MKKTAKKLSVLLTASVLTASVICAVPAPAVSAASKYQNLVVLGDSISSGYALGSGEQGYYDIVSECTGASVTNYAVAGSTTSDLLNVLSDSGKQAAVKKADLICISIGANDLLKPAQEYFQKYQKDGETLVDTLKRLAAEGDATYHIGQLTKVTRDARNAAPDQYAAINAKLRELNPDAEIVMQTLYNPFEVTPEQYTGLSEKNQANYDKLMNFINNMELQLNKVIRGLENIKVAEIPDAFSGTGWLYVRIREKDVHPTAAGHALIGAVILDLLGVSGKTSAGVTAAAENMLMTDYQALPADDLALLKKYMAPSGRLFGDTDRDNEVAVGDAQLTLQYYTKALAGRTTAASLMTAGDFSVSDVSGDGAVDIDDAQFILQYYTYTLSQKAVKWSELTGNPNAPD